MKLNAISLIITNLIILVYRQAGHPVQSNYLFLAILNYFQKNFRIAMYLSDNIIIIIMVVIRQGEEGFKVKKFWTLTLMGLSFWTSGCGKRNASSNANSAEL